MPWSTQELSVKMDHLSLYRDTVVELRVAGVRRTTNTSRVEWAMRARWGVRRHRSHRDLGLSVAQWVRLSGCGRQFVYASLADAPSGIGPRTRLHCLSGKRWACRTRCPDGLQPHPNGQSHASHRLGTNRSSTRCQPVEGRPTTWHGQCDAARIPWSHGGDGARSIVSAARRAISASEGVLSEASSCAIRTASDAHYRALTEHSPGSGRAVGCASGKNLRRVLRRTTR